MSLGGGTAAAIAELYLVIDYEQTIGAPRTVLRKVMKFVFILLAIVFDGEVVEVVGENEG